MSFFGSPMFMFLLIFIIIIIVIVIKENKKRKNLLDSILNNTNNFTASFIIRNWEERYMIAIDDDRRKIIYINENKNIKQIFEFKDVISVNLIEDSNIIYSKSAARTIGGGIIGGIIGGGAGAVIGGLSGSSEGSKVIDSIKVKILLQNNQTSAIYIDCLNSSVGTRSDSFTYKLAIEEAIKITDKISVIINLIEREGKSTHIDSDENKSTNIFSLTEELEKLYNLKEKGIVSEDEYEIIKKELIRKL